MCNSVVVIEYSLRQMVIEFGESNNRYWINAGKPYVAFCSYKWNWSVCTGQL